LRKDESDLVARRVRVADFATSSERRRVRLYGVQVIIDAGCVVLAFAVAGYAYLGERQDMTAIILPAEFLLPLYMMSALQSGTYSLQSLTQWHVGVSRSLVALAISAGLLNLLAFFAKMNATFSRVEFLMGMLLTAVLLAAARFFRDKFVRRWLGPSPLNVLVIDDNGPPIELPYSYRVDATRAGLRPSLDDPQALDLFARYVRNMDQVIVSCPPERRVAWAMVLKGSGIQGEVHHDFLREIGAIGVVRREKAGLTTLQVSTGPLGLRNRAMKRLLDLCASLLALVLVLPILLLAAAAIKLEDGGPVVFRQNRVGRRNQMFGIYKLRTMKVERTDSDGNRSASRDDDRITRVGRFLRSTSIDELPQLFNCSRAT
jgi:hypothetical protein